jgi:ribosomal protein S18 acetylase RimI-like enzyme
VNAAQLEVHLRWMSRRDLDQVLAIEQECFDHPWHSEDFLRVMQEDDSLVMVAEHGGDTACGGENCPCSVTTGRHRTGVNLERFR